MQLAQREIVELKRELRRHVTVRNLLARQHDVETDALRADVGRAAVRCFHDARSTPGHDHALEGLVLVVLRRQKGPEATRFQIVVALEARSPLPALRCGIGVGNARAAEDDDRRLDAMGAQRKLGLQILEHEPHAAQLVGQQKLVVGKREPIARRQRLRRRHFLLRRAQVFVGARKRLNRQFVGHVVHLQKRRCGSGFQPRS
jgi:hypothetical protein